MEKQNKEFLAVPLYVLQPRFTKVCPNGEVEESIPTECRRVFVKMQNRNNSDKTQLVEENLQNMELRPFEPKEV